MNTFRANISFLIKDGYSISLSDLQLKYYENYGDKDICTLENLRKLGPSFVRIQEWDQGAFQFNFYSYLIFSMLSILGQWL